MLKIKDDVDLKELEKFGFEKNSYGGYTYKIQIDEYWYRPKDKHKKLAKDISTENIIVNTERNIFIT